MKIYTFHVHHGESSLYFLADNLAEAKKLWEDYQEQNIGVRADWETEEEYVEEAMREVDSIFETELITKGYFGYMDWTEPEDDPFSGKIVWGKGLDKVV